MKPFLITIGLIATTLLLQAQEKSDRIGNLEFGGSIILDNVNNLSGGIQSGSSLLSLFDLNLDYSFNNGFLKNTSFQAHILKTAGKSSSENLIGDVQVASNIDGYATHFVYELLIKQRMADFSITAGMHDLNSEFMTSDFAGDFINSSFGIAPAVTLNVPVSVFPKTTFGGLLVYDNQTLAVKAGFYNLNHDYLEEESFSSKNHFFQHGFLSVTELSYRIIKDNSIKGEYKIGGYLKKCDQHQHDIPVECFSETNYGLYFIGDQTVKQFTKGQQLGAFVQLSFAPHTTNFASQYYGAGISVRELSSKWMPKQLGLAFGAVKLNHVFFNDEPVNNDRFETVVELTAQIPILNHLMIQPDFQYIMNPSGMYQNSFTCIIRLIFELN